MRAVLKATRTTQSWFIDEATYGVRTKNHLFIKINKLLIDEL